MDDKEIDRLKSDISELIAKRLGTVIKGATHGEAAWAMQELVEAVKRGVWEVWPEDGGDFGMACMDVCLLTAVAEATPDMSDEDVRRRFAGALEFHREIEAEIFGMGATHEESPTLQ